jgi:hypothetical protein
LGHFQSSQQAIIPLYGKKTNGSSEGLKILESEFCFCCLYLLLKFVGLELEKVTWQLLDKRDFSSNLDLLPKYDTFPLF